jgi:hypothetical protein
MKKSILTNTLIIAGIVAIICAGTWIVCTTGNGGESKFVPDDPEIIEEADSDDTETAELKPVSYISKPQSTSKPEEKSTEAVKEEKIEAETTDEIVIYLNDPASTTEVLPPETPGTKDDAPVETPEYVGKPQSDPDSVTPSPGSFNENGDVYMPGFGWIPFSGPGETKKSGSDGDWNKIIGSFN